ncbi:hypothetical protein XENTR_v10013974 [Xenopus tropicalis]|uniref:Chromosome 6 open reading frame 58 n=1 Tax=Xenopus tropicalis TaxID=8364 RepID=A0A6I8RW12_XENTR|nr:protein LEG1 homolog [Xenopus tropicalis]KAE8602396.1 hypothetical protein XENTR_v10013974 [Xenopus tropicalis]
MLLAVCLVLCINYADFKEVVGDGFPPMWNSVPDNLEYFRVQNSKVIINPWNYRERMAMYKILLNITAQYLDMKQQDNKQNMLWGLPLQLGWQFSTGRLSGPLVSSTCGDRNENQTCISDRSWWACINYYLSVIPFLGAFDAGFFSEYPYKIEISKPKEFISDYCFNITDCRLFSPEAMEEWKTFFEFIKLPRQKLEDETDKFLFRMWKAHVVSVSKALPLCAKRLKYASEREGNFGIDWASGVEFIAATHFHTDFKNTNTYQIYLPHRMLIQEDNAPYIDDFSEGENRVLSSLQKINKINHFTGGSLLRLWKKAMCSAEGRIEGRQLLQNMAAGDKLQLINIFGALKELIRNATC